MALGLVAVGGAVSDPLLSSSWYRVAQLRPSLRQQARFHRHVYRGQVWYVVHDRATGRSHRLSPAAHLIAGRMNGARTVQELWDGACQRLGDEAPTQDEAIRVLGVLHSADALQCGVSPDLAEMFARTRRREDQEGWRRFLNPVMIRFPLTDPDPLLRRWLPVVEPLSFTRERWPSPGQQPKTIRGRGYSTDSAVWPS